MKVFIEISVLKCIHKALVLGRYEPFIMGVSNRESLGFHLMIRNFPKTMWRVAVSPLVTASLLHDGIVKAVISVINAVFFWYFALALKLAFVDLCPFCHPGLIFGDGAEGFFLHVEGKQARFIFIVFPLKRRIHSQCYYIPLIQSSISAGRMLEIPFLKLSHKGKSSYRESSEIRKTFTSPVLDQYERVAANYRNYINGLSPKIETICEKENYRSYLKEQKLNVIKSQLITKKQNLQKHLQEKLDPTKSVNGKLHTEILSLTELQANYSTILADIEKNIREKQEQIRSLGETVSNQREIIKSLLKYDFKQSQLPKIINRNSSESSFWSRDSGKSIYKHSRESIISKLSSNIMSRTNDRINLEEQKLIMLKLFLVYYHSESQQSQSSAKLAESLEKQLAVREELIKDIKKELREIEAQRLSQQ